jgi:hypothetical protein
MGRTLTGTPGAADADFWPEQELDTNDGTI